MHATKADRLASTEILVIGSGAAGSTAAITAARLGKRVTLVERYGFLGGISTGVLDTFYGFYTPGPVARKVVGGVPDAIVERLLQTQSAFVRPNTFGAGNGITYDPEMLKCVWEDLAIEANVRLLYHSFYQDVRMSGNRVTGVVLDGKAGLKQLDAQVIIDASGDADVAAQAGARFERAEAGSRAQTLTTTFRVGQVDMAKARTTSKQELRQLMHEANDSGAYQLPREDGSIHPTPLSGIMLAIMTRLDGYDPCDPESLTQAEIEGRRQAREYVRFLHDRVPGYERAHLLNFSIQVGIRESRRIFGDYRLTKTDVLGAKKFVDSIGQCGAPIEDHHRGRDTHWEFLPDGTTYDIPYRTLLPAGVDGLLVAGRCFSATHDAHASCRSMAQCMAMGQAAGVAAAIAVDQNVTPRHIETAALQAKLVELGGILYDDQTSEASWV